jgi:ABC-type antimicrobial peptide transport system permease subunit
MAIGASPHDMLRMVIREGLLQVGAGVVLGVGLAIGTSRVLEGLLFGVTTASPLHYVVVSLVLFTAAVVACAAPARRAMRIDPVVAIRGE